MSNAYGTKSALILSLAFAVAVLTFVPPPAAGQEQVMNPSNAAKGSETLELKELWRVGGYDDEDALFGVITDVIADRDGSFYLLDSQLNEVQVYSSGGEFQRTIGREGEGPGEFRAAFNLLLLPNGNIGVLQAFPSKIIGLTPDGNPADDFELPKGENEVGFKVLFTARNAGDQLAVVYGFNQPSESGFTQQSVLSLFGPAGDNERRLFSQDATMNAADPVIAETEWDTFRNRWTSGPDGRVYSAVDRGEYKINVWGKDGTLKHVINREYPAHKRSDEQSERILNIYKGFTRQIPIPNIRYEIEPNWNPVQAINARDDGTLWVQTSRGAWDLAAGELGRYDIFNQDGKLERQVTLKGQGNAQTDGYFFVKDRLFVVTDFLDALMALQGGAGTAEEVDEEAEPMEIICYQLPLKGEPAVDLTGGSGAMSSFSRLLRILCVPVLLLVVSVIGCGTDATTAEDPTAEGTSTETAGSTESAEPKTSRRETSTTVSTALVMRRDLVLPVKAEGRIRARHTSEIKFERAGRIDRISVQEGQRIHRGQLLVRLDDRELRLSLEEAMSRYLQGLGQLAVEEDGYREGKDAERTLDKQRAELEKRERAGEITRQERLDLELELGMSAVRDGAYRRELLEVRSGVAAARAEAARLRIELERTEVRAPFAGVISGLDLNQGEKVQVGQTFCRLVDDVNVEAAVGVLESDLSVVTVGKPALLEVPALGQSIPLKVDVIDPEVATDSRTCRVLLRLRSDEQRVKPGMFVRAWIAGEIVPDRLLVPRQAIVTRDGRPVLFKVEDDRALWVYVQLGRQNDQLVEIARVDQGGPLDPGTQVIVSNHLTMTHEAKVKVKETIEVPDLWSSAEPN